MGGGFCDGAEDGQHPGQLSHVEKDSMFRISRHEGNLGIMLCGLAGTPNQTVDGRSVQLSSHWQIENDCRAQGSGHDLTQFLAEDILTEG
jgi:hypothetical protein